MYKCPECDSTNVVVVAEQMFFVNTGEHYCHSVKCYDSNATAVCLDCNWNGIRINLVSSEEK